MHTISCSRTAHLGGGVILLAALLAGCGDKPSAPGKPQAPAVLASAAGTEGLPPPAVVVAAPPVSSPLAAAGEPPLDTMKVARTNSKMGVPVDLRYQFDGDALAGQTVTLHLAAVPRVPGSHLAVSIKQVPGIQTASAALSEQKVSADTAYRRQVSVTRLEGGPTELRVLVTMDLPIGSGFSYFSVPLGATAAPDKQAPVKLR